MKKTFSMILAVLMAAVVACTFSVVGFADETTTNDDPVDNFVTTTEATTKAATTAAPTTTAPATTVPATTVPATTSAETTSTETTTSIIDGILGMLSTTVDVSKDNEAEEIVTRVPGQTVIDDGDETTAAPATTKKPAKVESSIPSTGSSIVPAVALLALAAGVVAVVKTKKED